MPLDNGLEESRQSDDDGGSWQDVFRTSEEYSALIKSFDNFHTVDWANETYIENRDYYRELLKSHQGSMEEGQSLLARFRGGTGRNPHDTDGGYRSGYNSDFENELDEDQYGDSLFTNQEDSNEAVTASSSVVDVDSHQNSTRSRYISLGRQGSVLGRKERKHGINSRIVHQIKRRVSRIQIVKSRLWITFQVWFALTLIGGMVGFIAGCLNIITEWLGDLKEGYCSTGFYLNKSFCCWGEAAGRCSSWIPWSSIFVVRYVAYIMFSVLFGTIAAVLCKYYAPTAAGSGISEVKCIVSGFVTDKMLGWSTLFIKSIGLPLVITSGLNVGKEGPSVHYAACAGYVVSKLFSNFEHSFVHQSQFLTAASASGVAVAFASPIGGVLFSIEEITSNFKLSTLWESYYCALVATGILSVMNSFRNGQIVIFQVSYDTTWRYFEIPFFIVLGIFGGIYGIVVSKFNIKWVAFRNKYLKKYPVTEVAVLCLLTAAIGYFSEFIRLDMTEGMGILFHECRNDNGGDDGVTGFFENEICEAALHKSTLIRTIVSLFFSTALRMLFIIISYNSKIPCGIFVPSMAAGATFGKAIGLISESIFNDPEKCLAGKDDCIISGTYAFLGAAAGLCGITNLTLAVVIIMFELTGALNYIIPTMIIVAVTKIVGDNFGIGMGGVCDQMVRFNGIPFLDVKEEPDYGDHTINDVMTTDVVALPYNGLKFSQLDLLLKETKFSVYPIIESETTRAVVGVTTKRNLISACKAAKREASRRAHAALSANTNATGSSNSRNHSFSTISSGTIRDLENKTVRFVSDEKVTSITGIAHSDDEGLSEENELNFEDYVLPEGFSIEVKTSLHFAFDIFAKLGPQVIIVEDEGKLAGLVTRKDLVKFELYLHYSEHGNVFLSPQDEIIFEKIWQLVSKIGKVFKKAAQKPLCFRKRRQSFQRSEIEIDVMPDQQ